MYDASGQLAAEYAINVPAPSSPTISYLTEDALGSVRAVTNSFGEIKARRDFLPFGDEIYAGIGGRNANQKYSSNADDTRKKFATYQRDAETGLDFAQSRYYSPMHGRFTSPDEFKGGPDELFDFEEDASDNPTFYADLENPQSLNKYQYGYNNPYKFNDPTGHCPPCGVAWAVFEVVATVYDVVDTVRTVLDPNASRQEKIAAAGGTLAGVFLPGGGYGTVAKTVVKALRREAVEQVVKKAQRTAGLKYQPDSIRQDYTGYQKDEESGLEFAQARYYNTIHGRFTSVDPLTASASIKNPQTFNRYSHVLNSPYKLVDPLGLISSSTGANGGRAWCGTCQTTDDEPWFADPPPAPPSHTNEAEPPVATANHEAGHSSQQQAAEPAPPCPRGHMCFGTQTGASEKTNANSTAPTGDAASNKDPGPVLIVNGNPLQRTPSGGLSIMLDSDAAFFISYYASEAAGMKIEVQGGTTLALDLMSDGGFSLSASKPILIPQMLNLDAKVNSVRFDDSGKVVGASATFLGGNVSSQVRGSLNNALQRAMVSDGSLGVLFDPLPRIVRRMSQELWGRKGPPLVLTIRRGKKLN